MSHEKHDQNQGLDTPDTTPSFFRIIMYGLIGYGLVSCVTYGFLYGFDLSDRAEEIEQNQIISEQLLINAFPPAAYLSDPFKPELSQDQVQQSNLTVVEDPAGLGTLLGTNTTISLVLVDETLLQDEANLAILRQQLALGRMIVGLRIPHSEMAELLQQTTTAADLERNEVVDAAVWISGWYTDDAGNLVDISKAYGEFSAMLAETHQLSPNLIAK